MSAQPSFRALSILLLLTGLSSEAAGGEERTQPFDVETGIIEMKKTTTNAAFTARTTETLYFKDWGRVQARVSTETTSNKYVKGEQVARKFTLLEGTTLTTVDLDTKKGTRVEIPLSQALGSMSRQDASAMAGKLADAMKTQMKPAGEATVAGKSCQVTEAVTAMGPLQQTTTTCLWNNIILKLESKGMGTEAVEEAVSVETDVAIPPDKFKPPDGVTISDVKMP